MQPASIEFGQDLCSGIVEDSPDGIVAFGLDGRIRFMNAAARVRRGLALDAVVAGGAWMALWPEAALSDAARALQSGRAGRGFVFQTEVLQPGGDAAWLDVVVSPLRDSDGAVAGLVSDCRASTANMLALREAAAREQSLVKTTAAMRAAQHLAQLGGWEYDCVRRRVSFAAELSYLIAGAPQQDREEALKVWVAEDASAFESILDEAVREGRDFSFEGRIHAPDGSVRWVRVVGEPQLDSGGCVAMRGATQDITEQRAAVERLRASEQSARQAAEAMSSFLATMSHEIRTPLNGILGMVQILALGELSETQRCQFSVIETSGEALLVLLNDLLDLSRVAAGKIELEDGVVDIDALAKAIGVFARLAQEKNVDFSVVTDAGTRRRWTGDPTRVQQVLNNLVGNAVKFTERGSVEVGISECNGRLRLEVRDTGVGIPADKLDAIFERFVQADGSTTRRFGGSGLGLAICRELVTLMGGDIIVESTLGAGAIFTVNLPLAPVDPSGELDEAVGDAPAVGLRVLVAEDNAMNQTVLKAMLATFGVDPTIVDNGQEAFNAWRGDSWDLILMDIQMPVMDGISATRAIREVERSEGRTRTPVIAVTANAMTHHRAEYHAAGMDGFVAKPLKLEALIEAIDAGLQSCGIPLAA
jgi:PAS domain S-box-containing protein